MKKTRTQVWRSEENARRARILPGHADSVFVLSVSMERYGRAALEALKARNNIIVGDRDKKEDTPCCVSSPISLIWQFFSVLVSFEQRDSLP